MTRILIALAAAALLATAGDPAMAAKGTCDPSPDPYNVQSMTKANGAVTIEIRYGWDGVSVWPDCQGPIIRIRVTNSSNETWYAHLTGKRGQPRTVAINPGDVKTYSGTQLATVGIETIDDLAELTLTRIP